MPDISMCLNTSCTKSEVCYRSPNSGTVESEFRQSWSEFIQNDDETCKMFYPRLTTLGDVDRIQE
jgi:hypothetical protein